MDTQPTRAPEPRPHDHRNARILIVEDAAFDIGILQDAIEDMASISVATSAARALTMMRQAEFDLILLDVLLPDMNGFDLCREIKAQAGSREIPVVFISSMDDSGSEERGLALGAADYIAKPFVPSVVRARVNNQVALARATRELRKANEKLSLLAATDPLTGVFNRRQFETLCGDWLGRGETAGRQACFLMMDLDHFKSVNDRRGHKAGDAVLIAMAKAWGETLRPRDILGRMGGEEFAVFLPETDIAQGHPVAERLCRVTRETAISVEGVPFHVSVSIGITPWKGGGDDLNEMGKRADQALYAAKRDGRDRVGLYDPASNG